LLSLHDACVFFRRAAWHVGDEQTRCRSPTRGSGQNQRRQIEHGRFRSIPQASRLAPIVHSLGDDGGYAVVIAAGWAAAAEWTTSGEQAGGGPLLESRPRVKSGER
jgi:hypothetical protein